MNHLDENGESTSVVPDCDLCLEASLAASAVTGSIDAPEIGDVTTIAPFSRLVRRTSVADVMAGLGAIVPGYLIVYPRRHVGSVGELSSRDRSELMRVVWLMVSRVRERYQTEVVVSEHGSSGEKSLRGGACIVHAHLHIFPVAHGTWRSYIPEGSTRISGTAALQNAANENRNYYYSAITRDESYLLLDPLLPSQWARRQWASANNDEFRWDWGAFPHYEAALATTQRMRRDSVSGSVNDSIDETSKELAETIEAYNVAADWYATRTRGFPPRSTLQPEMDSIVERSHGTILDAGAGAGRDAAYFADSGRNVIALDASKALLARIPRHERITTVYGDVRDIPLSNESVGAVWCSAVLVHLDEDDFAVALEEFYRVLTPGGIAQISTKEGRGSSSYSIPKQPEVRRHFYYYDSGSLKSYAESAGFSVEASWEEHEHDADSFVQTWIKVLLRKSR